MSFEMKSLLKKDNKEEFDLAHFKNTKNKSRRMCEIALDHNLKNIKYIPYRYKDLWVQAIINQKDLGFFKNRFIYKYYYTYSYLRYLTYKQAVNIVILCKGIQLWDEHYRYIGKILENYTVKVDLINMISEREKYGFIVDNYNTISLDEICEQDLLSLIKGSIFIHKYIPKKIVNGFINKYKCIYNYNFDDNISKQIKNDLSYLSELYDKFL